MGQEILYCYKCQTRLLGSEFEKGKAFKVGGQASCPDCVKDLLASMPEAQIDDRKLSSTSKIRVPSGPDSSSKLKPATVRSAPPLPAPAPESSKTPLIIAFVVGAIVLLVLAFMMGSGNRRPDPGSSNSSGPVPPPAPPPTPPKPEDVRPPPPGSPFAAELREIDEKMRTGLGREEFRQVADLLDAARKRRSTAEWLSEIDLRIPQVEARASHAALALRDKAAEALKSKNDSEHKRLRDRVVAWGFTAVIDKFDKAVAEANEPPKPPPPPPLPGSSAPPLVLYDDDLAPGIRNWSWNATLDFAATSPVFEGARAIAFTPKISGGGLFLQLDDAGVNPAEYGFVTFALRMTQPNSWMGLHLYSDVKDTPFDLSKSGVAPPAGEWKRYVIPVASVCPTATKITGFCLQIYVASTTPLAYVDSIAFLKTAESTIPAPPPPKPAAAELDAYRARWSQAAAKAALRDYAGAQRDVEEGSASLKDAAARAEAAADLELIKLAAQVPVEAFKIVEKWPKGQKVRVEFLNGAGEREAAEGTVVAADATRLTLLKDGPLDLPTGELLPATLAEIFRGRVDRKPTDARAAAAFCLFEGDLEAAKKLWGDGPAIPEKLQVAPRERSAAELAARKSFWAAESDFASPRRRPAAVEKYASLLAGEANPFLARVRPFVAARMEAAKDNVFLADDLAAAGTFLTSGSTKLDAVWTSIADSAAGKARENYVEAEFYAFPGAAYRAWVWAGACCQETFEFWIQASDLTMANPKNSKEPLACEPGAEIAQTAKAPSLSLKKWHAGHGGPKEPAKWDWFPVALPKYEAGGAKKIRVLSSQQGFSVGAIVVSAVRRDTPRETEMKDLEKSRFGTRKIVANSIPGCMLYEYWMGIDGSAVEDLTRNPAFTGRPTGYNYRELFEAPTSWADKYGARMRGWVHPPATGAYTFWISSDDGSELWLSADDMPAKKRLVASCAWAGAVRDWTRTPTSKSAPIPLTAGKRYYIEALHKEGGGDDHLAVGWTLPDGSDERPIPGARLSAWSLSPPAPGPAGTVFYKGFNINGDPVLIDGRKWEGKKSSQLGSSGDNLNFPNVPLTPPTDDDRTAMIRDFTWQSGGSSVKIYQVPPGSYQVYLYVWENDFDAVYDLFVQGREVLKGHHSGAPGHWDKLGPYPAAVTEAGNLDVRSQGGDANFSGLEIWKVVK